MKKMTDIRCRLGIHKRGWTPDKGHADGCSCDVLAAYVHCGQEIICVRCEKRFQFNDNWCE